MIAEMLRTQKRRLLLYTLIVFSVMAVVFTAVAMYEQNHADTISRIEIDNNESNLIDIEKTLISGKVERLVSDALYIADSLHINETFHHDDYSEIVQQWISFSNGKGVYDQIRYLDLDGNEIIRVNYDETCAIAVASTDLQNKKDRYYFTSTISLAQNEVYISAVDLNIENGVLEEPIKPMLRIGTPYFTEDGVLTGVVILNYYVDEVLRQIQGIASASHGEIWILNADGYWIFNAADTDKAWGFMYEDRLDDTFINSYPTEWEGMRESTSGIISTDNGVFNYTAMHLGEIFSGNGGTDLDIVSQNDEFYILSYLDPASQTGALYSGNLFYLLGEVLTKYNLGYLLVLAISVVLAGLITINKLQKEELQYNSQYDAMTGVYNRRAGFEKLNRMRKEGAKNACKMAVCFIDVNGLKEVNDMLGHETGDELLITVTDTLKSGIRGNDFIARLGGDEFLVVLAGLDTEGAESVWVRILEKIESINAEETRRYRISVSHGIDIFHCNGKETIDTVIQRADEIMYNEKRKIKKNLHVIRD